MPLTLDNTVRHLICHIYPTNHYKWHLEQIRNHLPLFNGRKVAAVVQGPRCAPLTKVRKLLPDVECFPVENSKKLREALTFPLLLDWVDPINIEYLSDGLTDLTFYCHTKGVSYKENSLPRGIFQAVQLWTESLFFHNLSRFDAILGNIGSRIMSGALKRQGIFPNFPQTCKWHYSGSFYWFKNLEFFARDPRRYLRDPERYFPRRGIHYTTEALPGMMLLHQQGGCIFGNDADNLYNLDYAREFLKFPVDNKVSL